MQPQISTSNPKTLPFTVTKPVTNREFSKPIEPHDVTHVFGEPSPLEASRFVIFSFLLTISRPPQGMSKQKNSFTLYRRPLEKTGFSRKSPLDFESFLEILFGLVLKHHCGCLRFLCLYLLPRSNRDRCESA